MADLMMRIAGRGEDGLAKAIKTNDFGRVEITNSYKRPLTFNQWVISGTGKIKTGLNDSLGYKFGSLNLIFAQQRRFKVYIIDYDDQTNAELIPRLIFSGYPSQTQVINYEILTSKYLIEIEASSDHGLALREKSFETLFSNNQFKNDSENRQEIKVNTKRALQFNKPVISKDEISETEIMSSAGYDFGRLSLTFASERGLSVSIVDFEHNNVMIGKREVFNGIANRSTVIDYEIPFNKYKIEIKATTEYGLSIRQTTYETLTMTDNKSGRVFIKEVDLGEISAESKGQVSIISDSNKKLEILNVMASVNAGEKGQVELNWYLGTESEENHFLQLIGEPNGSQEALKITAAGLKKGNIERPEKFKGKEMVEFLNFYSRTAIISQELQSTITLTNNTDKPTSKAIVKMIIKEL